MTATALLRKSQDDFTNSNILSVSEPIDYFHKRTLEQELGLRAFVNDDVFNDPKKNTRVSEGVFSSVKLASPPEEGDEILYCGRIYRVKIWILSQDRYIINAEHKRYHTGRRVTVD